MLKSVFLLPMIIFLLANNLLAQDAQGDIRYQVMDREIESLMALRERAMEEAMQKKAGRKKTVQFFFTLAPG